METLTLGRVMLEPRKKIEVEIFEEGFGFGHWQFY